MALEQRVLELERSKSLLERRIDDNESYGRKQNLRIFGIPNPKQGQKETEEECIKKVRVQIEKLNVENEDVNIKIDRAHRVGAQMKDKNGKLLDRPIYYYYSLIRTTVNKFTVFPDKFNIHKKKIQLPLNNIYNSKYI